MTLHCSAILFDLDGTLIDSKLAVERAWRTWFTKMGVDPYQSFERIHGRRAIDGIKLIAPDSNYDEEDRFLRRLESLDTEGVVPLPGVVALLASLPADRWGIVTSGAKEVALARLRAAQLPIPKVIVFGDEVTHGKPHPEPFLRGIELLGYPADTVIAFEDTEAGIHSITSAGATPVGVGLSHPNAILDFSSVHVSSSSAGLIVNLQ